MMATMEAHLEGQADRYDVDYRIRTADGEYRWFHDVGGITERTDDGRPGKVTGIVVDVTRQKRQEVELHRRADQLAVLNRIVRHDIRNDMNVAGGWLDVLRGEVPPDVRDRFDRVAGTIDDVVELTETVGDALEVIEGETPAADRAVDLGTVVEREAEKARARYDHATIETPAPTPEATVRASELFASVVRNLLNNAVQHGDESSPHVAVTIEERAGTVVLRVVDDGPGVPDDRKDDVFGRGEQGLDSEGTGVGLYLVDRLVDAYGGTVRVEDAEPTGAAFVVELERAGEA
jgi:signal transduction histidine kinase